MTPSFQQIIKTVITIIIRWTPVASKTVAVAVLRRLSCLRVGRDKLLIRWLMTVIKDVTLRRGECQDCGCRFHVCHFSRWGTVALLCCKEGGCMRQQFHLPPQWLPMIKGSRAERPVGGCWLSPMSPSCFLPY